jgi:hypothetical protein
MSILVKNHRPLAVACAAAMLIASHASAADTMDARLAKQLGVPENLAHVVDGLQIADYELPSYILIQDVHRHAEVQNEIAAILLYGRRQWHLRDVFIEGAFDEVTRQSLLQRTSDSSLTAMVREGRLSGAGL